MIYNLKNDCLSVSVSSLGAEIQSVKCCGKEYMWEGREFWKKHAPLLFPICGSITEPYVYRGAEYSLEKHGFISDLDFKAVSASDTKLILIARETAQTLSSYPFNFEFTAKYTLNGIISSEVFFIAYSLVSVLPLRVYFAVNSKLKG